MDFELEPTHYKLHFEDPRLQGLEVTIARASLGEALRIDELRLVAPAGVKEAAEGVRELAALVGAHLVSWNLTKDGVPVPCDAAGITAQDGRVLRAILDAWGSAMSAVDAPLEPASNDGPTSGPAPSIPMEPLSPSPSS